MTQFSDRLNIEELSVAERVQLVEEIWASIAAEQASLGVTAAQRQELNRRLDSYRSSREGGSTWESVKDRLQERSDSLGFDSARKQEQT